MKQLSILILMALASEFSFAQKVLTLSGALDAALLHNHSLQISEIEVDKANNLATRGNAGQLPTLGINSDVNWAYSDIELAPGSFFQNLLNPDGSSQQPSAVKYDGVYSTQFNAGIGTELIIFDGMKGYQRYKLLQSGKDMAGLRHRSEVEQTVLTITHKYVQVASVQKAITLKELALEQSLDRFKIIENRRDFGQANEQQYLQALADLKTDSTEYRELKLKLDTIFRDFHTEIGWDKREQIPLEDKPSLRQLPEYEYLQSSLKENNISLQVRQQRIKNAEIEKKMVKGNFLPTLKANAQYGYSYMSATDGQFETQEQLGVMGGLTLKIPIFSGGRTKTAAQNASANIKQEQIRYDESEQLLQAQFDNAWQQYLFLQDHLKTERSNLNIFERNYERAKDSFDRGLITGVELRSAQLSLHNARFKISEIEYQLVTTQTTLMYLSGLIFKL